ncbi:hypothetical protein TRVL_08833 [Trypanosoma vivax]|nr:hypothetical protein TRVL_08833 [Trypanosoma vivax]
MEQAPNNAVTSAAASTVASSAVALRSATTKCAVARHAAQQSDQTCGKTSSFSAATQHSISFESAPHWPCSATRVTAPTTQASSVSCARPQSSALPPTATQMDGQCDGHGGAWSLSLRVTSVLPCRRVACASSEAT